MARIVLLFLTMLTIVFGNSTVILKTKLGNIKGISSSFTFDNYTRNYNEFRNIPFAKPPVGDLRFHQPIPYGGWGDTYDATRFGPSCIQSVNGVVDQYVPNTNTSEDCLVLNIYVPSGYSESNAKSVIIWVHGGGYYLGQGMFYDGSYLSGIGDVIVVTINYRLGAFGFFSTLDDVALGNYGLWDQQMAIKWVHDNIESFGGNPNSITIAGQSAGGFSVALQAIYPANKGLFHRVIAQSGASNSFITMSDAARKNAKLLSMKLNCNESLTKETLTCLRNKTAKQILDVFNTIPTSTYSINGSKNVYLNLPFAPVVDGVFLKQSPQNILYGKPSPELEFYKSLDFIFGGCELEGIAIPYGIREIQNRLSFNISDGIPSDYFRNHIIPVVVEQYFNNNSALASDIYKQFVSSISPQDQAINVVNLYSDLFFYFPEIFSLKYHASGNHNIKQYLYSFRTRTMFSEQMSALFPWYKGNGHGADMYFLFPFRGQESNLTTSDRIVGTMLMKYWSNFAKTGNVNGPGLVHWPTYDDTTKKYALLDINTVINSNLYGNRMEFWSKIMNLNQPGPTTPCSRLECILGRK